jgi:hypothetical protein
MKQSFDLTNLLLTHLKQIKSLQILNDEDNQDMITYQRICSGDASNDVLPKPIVIFRFQSNDTSDVSLLRIIINLIYCKFLLLLCNIKACCASFISP